MRSDYSIPRRIVRKLRECPEPKPERTEADRAYLLWREAKAAHGDEWAWRRLGIRSASIEQQI